MRPGREDLRPLLARLPSVHVLQRHPGIRELRSRYEDRRIDTVIRMVLRDARNRIRYQPHAAEKTGLQPQILADRVVAHLESESGSLDGALINASGILFHPGTRDRYAGTAARRASDLALIFAAYEEKGRIAGLLRELTGAEDALVARSVPAALLLAVQSIAKGKEVVINRSHLGLIDGPYDGRPVDPVSFCGLAGARVVETGATNKTRLSDYRSAVGNQTALITCIRPYTYAIRGFTEEAGLEEIVRTGAETGATVLYLAGDTTLRPVASAAYEPACSVAEALRFGTPLIILAGGGLIGGPPCGLLLGRRHVLAPIRGHGQWPAMQASRHVRAGLEARLKELSDSPCDLDSHPAVHMLTASRDEVGARARALVDLLSKNGRFRASCAVVERPAYLTPYRLPHDSMTSFAVSVHPEGARSEDLAGQAVRWARGTPSLLVDYGRDRLLIDMRGVEKCRIPDVARIVEADL